MQWNVYRAVIFDFLTDIMLQLDLLSKEKISKASSARGNDASLLVNSYDRMAPEQV